MSQMFTKEDLDSKSAINKKTQKIWFQFYHLGIAQSYKWNQKFMPTCPISYIYTMQSQYSSIEMTEPLTEQERNKFVSSVWRSNLSLEWIRHSWTRLVLPKHAYKARDQTTHFFATWQRKYVLESSRSFEVCSLPYLRAKEGNSFILAP